VGSHGVANLVAFRMVTPEQLEWEEYERSPGRFRAALTELAGLRHTQANVIRQAPGAAGPRHAERVQDETFVPLSARLTMYLGEPQLGPLYHLTERQQVCRRLPRLAAFSASGVSQRRSDLTLRVARRRDGEWVPGRPALRRNRGGDFRDGQHRNPENIEGWFTTAYFHLPVELALEVEQAGLTVERLVGVEGPGGWLRWLAGAARKDSPRRAAS
jgi:hypothetical protein